jgi:hypothetical protein
MPMKNEKIMSADIYIFNLDILLEGTLSIIEIYHIRHFSNSIFSVFSFATC